ncbi:hypothetical protein CDAR_61161 [Caerostris darwini]|uniref:Uncharacterized protein n=1 Tax=Caerostris darwini TaxID=1538125 RepID=A0AAV4USV2_9ARAC|nr:hypothetical protein CDAR_61161 [Caerostris darwini]
MIFKRNPNNPTIYGCDVTPTRTNHNPSYVIRPQTEISSMNRVYLPSITSPSQVPPAPDKPISGNCTLACPIYGAIFPDELFAFTLNSNNSRLGRY